MSIIELFFIALSLAMDAFAVSIMYGMSIHHFKLSKHSFIALYFGFFQALMPLIGFYLGHCFSNQIASIDHYVAFVLLSFIGFHMIKESFEEDDSFDSSLRFFDVTILAIATSIDALAVGMTFAFFEVDIHLASPLIGIVTTILCFFALIIGHIIGKRFKNKAECIGGIILVILAIKILIEHLD